MKKGKRILLLTFYYQPDLCAGSFRATAFMDAFKEIMEPEDSVDVVTTIPNRYKTYKVDAQEFEQDRNVNIYRIPLPTHASGLVDQAKSFSKYFFKALSITKNKDYDLVMATSSRLFTAFLGSISARRFGTPLYLDIRDIFTDTMNEVLTNKLLKMAVMPFLQLIERFSFGRADHINLVSEGFKEYFENRYNTSFSYYTNGIDSEFLEYNFDQTIRNTQPVITYAGNIGEGQGLHIVIPKAAKDLEGDYQFRIIGDGGAKKKLLEAIENLKVTNVELVNPVNREVLKRHYRDSDFLFLHLNDFEAFKKVLPSKIFEYAATNKPVIGGVGGYAATFLKENVSDSIVFAPGDVSGFVSQMRNFRQGNFERASFIEKYSRANVMRKMVNQIKKKFL